MSSPESVVDVRSVSKRYEIYATPRDRLKQMVLPRLLRAGRQLAGRVGVAQTSSPPQFFREFWALRDITFQVRGGETLGIIGKNGSGKSTLLQILAGTMAPTAGEVAVNGRVAALLELGSGFNPEFTGRENVLLNARILGLTQQEIDARYDQIVEFADIGDFIDQPVRTYSSGMFVRLAFAVQAHLDASVVIIDEALAVGDIFFRQKCYARLEQLRESGAAILLVSHSLPEIEQFCERALLLDQGYPRLIGPASEVTKHYYLLNQPGPAKALSQEEPLVNEETHASPVAAFTRPPAEACLDLPGKSQVTNGLARCTGLALLNADHAPCASFRQGETAVFYYEFELNEEIGVPVCGMVIKNDKGTIVYGKNSLQIPGELNRSGARFVGCRQEVTLALAPGEYSFQVGLASIAPDDYQNRHLLPQELLDARVFRICHVPNSGAFSISLALRNGVSYLTHHGIADLPTSIHQIQFDNDP